MSLVQMKKCGTCQNDFLAESGRNSGDKSWEQNELCFDCVDNVGPAEENGDLVLT